MFLLVGYDSGKYTVQLIGIYTRIVVQKIESQGIATERFHLEMNL
jgi:hypothetical protein